jgi:hypothetical protein
LNVVNPLREEREYAVLEAARREREAWQELERATRPEDVDEPTRRVYRERWHAAAEALANALRNLKP